jgi:peptide/nickel transport system substrate-binding protein/oligopeptide transport system substrate-binding protein
VEQTPWATYQSELDRGAYDLFLLGWAADYADPQDFLDVLFHSASALNRSGFADPVVDRLLEAARTAPESSDRLALYAQAEGRILDSAPWVPLYSGVDVWVVAPYVKGFGVATVVVPRLQHVWLTEP